MNKDKLRNLAITQTLDRSDSLRSAIGKIGFIQADPIRSPSKSQDLVLRVRVKDYIEGDLEHSVLELDLQEDYLYAYGFMTRQISNLFHPKKKGNLSLFDKKVLDKITMLGKVSSKELEPFFGKKTVRNWWSGRSRAVKLSLDVLNYWGLVKVVKREGNFKIYEARESDENPLPINERKKRLILALLKILSPIRESKFSESTRFIRAALGDIKNNITEMIKSGELIKDKIDGQTYLWLKESNDTLPHQGVKILSPFDPIVWDRKRFEHIWGWQYRFEAYTPSSKRVRGYYAMPLLWNEDIVGWVNIIKDNRKLVFNHGFVKERPKDKSFEMDFEAEKKDIQKFLHI